MESKDIILQLIEKRNGSTEAQYNVTRWPDTEAENQRTKAVDGYAECLGYSALSIEHSKIESFKYQIRDDKEFQKYFGELEKGFEKHFNSHIRLIFPLFALRKWAKDGNWLNIKEAICDWFLLNAETLPDGFSPCDDILGVPFILGVYKDSNRSLRSFDIGRWAPTNQEVLIETTLLIYDRLKAKSEQLSRCRVAGDKTILVLEYQDLQLGNATNVYKAFLKAQELIPLSNTNIDEVWLAETVAQWDKCFLFCMHGSEELMARVNPENFEWGSRYREMWANVLKQDFESINLQDYTLLSERDKQIKEKRA